MIVPIFPDTIEKFTPSFAGPVRAYHGRSKKTLRIDVRSRAGFFEARYAGRGVYFGATERQAVKSLTMGGGNAE